MTPEERIAKLEQRVENLLLMAGLRADPKPKRISKNQKIRQQFRQKLLKLK